MNSNRIRSTLKIGTIVLVFLILLPISGMITGCSEQAFAETENTEAEEGLPDNLGEAESQISGKSESEDSKITLSSWLKCIDDLNQACLDHGFTYDGSCSTATYQAALQGAKKTNCAKFLMWALNIAEIGGKSLLPSDKTKIYTKRGKLKGEDASYIRSHPELFRIIKVNGSVPELLADGTLKRGDIIGYLNRLHTECYIGKSGDKYKFLNYGPSFRSRKGYSYRTASTCRKSKNIVGLIIRIVPMEYDDEKPEPVSSTTVEQDISSEVATDLADHTEQLMPLETSPDFEETVSEPVESEQPVEEGLSEQSQEEPLPEQQTEEPEADEHTSDEQIEENVEEAEPEQPSQEPDVDEALPEQPGEEQEVGEPVSEQPEEDEQPADDDPIYIQAEPDDLSEPDDVAEPEHVTLTAKTEHLYRKESSDNPVLPKMQKDYQYKEGEDEPYDTAYYADRRQASDIPDTGDETMILPYSLCCLAATFAIRKWFGHIA